jgi:hypothetical protein
MRRTTGYTWTHHKTSTDITKESNITPVLDKIQDYGITWIQHINRIPRNRLRRLIKNYTPKMQKETIEEISGCVRTEGIKKWPNS